MIDVLNEIKDLLKFNSEDDFYYLQIIKRKKENKELGSNSKVIKNYYIGSIEYLENKYEEIKTLCNIFNARAMLRLNKRSKRKVAFKTLENIAHLMSNSEYGLVKRVYDKACGQSHNDKDKKWIVDVDEPYTEELLDELKEHINSIEPNGDKILKELITKNGIHLITKPFNVQEFKTKFPNIDIHKDNPINLYIP